MELSGTKILLQQLNSLRQPWNRMERSTSTAPRAINGVWTVLTSMINDQHGNRTGDGSIGSSSGGSGFDNLSWNVDTSDGCVNLPFGGLCSVAEEWFPGLMCHLFPLILIWLVTSKGLHMTLSLLHSLCVQQCTVDWQTEHPRPMQNASIQEMVMEWQVMFMIGQRMRGEMDIENRGAHVSHFTHFSNMTRVQHCTEVKCQCRPTTLKWVVEHTTQCHRKWQCKCFSITKLWNIGVNHQQTAKWKCFTKEGTVKAFLTSDMTVMWELDTICAEE